MIESIKMHHQFLPQFAKNSANRFYALPLLFTNNKATGDTSSKHNWQSQLS